MLEEKKRKIEEELNKIALKEKELQKKKKELKLKHHEVDLLIAAEKNKAVASLVKESLGDLTEESLKLLEQLLRGKANDC